MDILSSSRNPGRRMVDTEPLSGIGTSHGAQLATVPAAMATEGAMPHTPPSPRHRIAPHSWTTVRLSIVFDVAPTWHHHPPGRTRIIAMIAGCRRSCPQEEPHSSPGVVVGLNAGGVDPE
jgi:hypothetical protein